jgi:hypothetical protein
LAKVPNLCARGEKAMTVVPHSSGQTDSQAVAQSQRRTKGVATGAVARTKGATTNALAASKDAWAKVSMFRRSRVAGRLAEIADKTSSQTKQATMAGLARAAEYGRESMLPELEHAHAKFKEHARPEQLKKDYRNFLHWLHERVLDPPSEQLFFIPTKEPVALSGLTVLGDNRAHGHDYYPSPCRLFEWTLAAVDYDFSKLTFVDHGAGKGRVLLLASEHPFAAIGGIEFAVELHDNAVMNIAQYPRSRMRCRNVECVLEDASQVGPPDGEAVHYMFNPFSREVFAEVLQNLVVSYRKRPRRLYLILIDPVATDLVDDSGVFMRIQLPPQERLKVRLFSPHEVAIYRSLA